MPGVHSDDPRRVGGDLVGGWQVEGAREDPDLLTPSLPEIHVSGMRLIDSVMSIVVVQAVVPKSLYIPASRMQPTLLITVKPVSQKMLANTEERLGVHDLGFSPIVRQEPGLVMTPVGADTYNMGAKTIGSVLIERMKIAGS